MFSHSEPFLSVFVAVVPPLVTRVTGSRALSIRRCLAASSAHRGSVDTECPKEACAFPKFGGIMAEGVLNF